MQLLKTFLDLVSLWDPAFIKHATFERAKDHSIASICSLGRHTVTNIILWLGRDQEDHSADYKLYNEYKWNVEDLFNPLLKQTLKYFPDKYIVVGADDTRIRKTGKDIPGTYWGRDPMSPPFQVNLMWGQRFLQFSCLLPLYKCHDVGSRAIPIRFVHCPPLQRPGSKATTEEHQAYKELSKTKNLSTEFVREVGFLRDRLNEEGCEKKLLVVGDGSFCNKICMNMDIANVEMLTRTRKNAKLCFRNSEASRKVYSEAKFTPEQVRQDESIPWKTATMYYGGKWREMRYKEVQNVLWQSGTKTRPLRLIVLAPIPYVKGGRRSYRQPGYLLTTDLEAPTEFLIQSYLDRWQIEVNFREEKSILGVGEAQVWNEKSSERQPGFRVACYSALLLASIIAYNDKPPSDFKNPKWRTTPPRNTCRALVGMLRSEIIDNPTLIFELGLTQPMVSAIFKKAA
jgi:hypothetical protein